MQESAYAQALLNLVEKGVSPKDAVRAIRDRLSERGSVALLPRVGRALVRLAEARRARDGFTLSVAREEDAARAKKAAHELCGGTMPNVLVDASLVGGWRLEGRGLLVDASYKKHLLEIYNRAVTK